MHTCVVYHMSRHTARYWELFSLGIEGVGGSLVCVCVNWLGTERTHEFIMWLALVPTCMSNV